MNEFDYEVKQRRNLANQAKYRKRGSKSKKCSLPSDGMSHKQWKERNGEIVSYNLNKPMGWEQFKQLPKEVQQEYIKRLQDKYDAAISQISSTMFGLRNTSLANYLRKNGIPYAGDKRRRSSEAIQAFTRFCNGETEPEPTPPQATDGAELPDDTEASNDTAVVSFEAQEATEPPRKPGMLLDSFTLQFSGGFDPDAIRNSLAMILQKGQQVRIEIKCATEG